LDEDCQLNRNTGFHRFQPVPDACVTITSPLKFTASMAARKSAQVHFDRTIAGDYLPAR
jgi:hypothetical protein